MRDQPPKQSRRAMSFLAALLLLPAAKRITAAEARYHVGEVATGCGEYGTELA